MFAETKYQNKTIKYQYDSINYKSRSYEAVEFIN